MIDGRLFMAPQVSGEATWMLEANNTKFTQITRLWIRIHALINQHSVFLLVEHQCSEAKREEISILA